ncbi:hypothetical protein CLAFUW4_11086 [Fulvia fulva]|uniref:Uncharacterized protein n=1 Tax=Passalora fulva TaxID=5499 RepID=A0A9Q8PCT4_PASFU|nr:uncharacterized protein CLAFUR5_10129 [Fulvia fulva]KAK4619960.1 hypothetical protein CLAFUR4_11091 [Fulvia fulva]KAK4621154.1 hypothetical protein CLAFUR0_11097 [Fulvia fulva]UJO20070.1 hypothetical protein CLAFUR5_10129 [Fulvia fulva]WPV17642.1 hypothetical protein CLAFUW4_11086 [Fulvia fulva]WPV32665.1 hypothetical protein CLAFUW7_11083 [Fulvia fulva]
MRLITLLAALLGLTQGIALPVPTDTDNSVVALNNTILHDTPFNNNTLTLTTNTTTPPFLSRNKPPHNWPSNWGYQPKHSTQVKLLRFKGPKCTIPHDLVHEEQIDIAPEGYEDDPNMACKQFKKENAMQFMWFQLPAQILKQGYGGDRGSVHYAGPLHHCRVVVYRGHFCDGEEVGSLDEGDEEVCVRAFGGHSMRVACWK